MKIIKESKCLLIVLLAVLISCQEDKPNGNSSRSIQELNHAEISEERKSIVLVGATLIDGTGAEPLRNSTVIIRNNMIDYAGASANAEIPDDAERFDATGLTLLPGLIDAHFHNDDRQHSMPSLFLSRGITSVRDPGAWIEDYDSARSGARPVPRLFLTGPHIDMYPPAYPENSYLVKDPEEGRSAVELFVSQGATAIKVYFRLPVAIIREICDAAHAHGIPVTGHLEIANARDAIEAGLDGIEHITSFGTCLLPPRAAENYKQMVMADNAARNRGRYETWQSLQLDGNPVADSIVNFLARKKTFVCPTLAVFERQPDQGDSVAVGGFANMLKFTGMVHAGGGRIVVGSHTWVPYAPLGYSYFREMELFHQAGMEPMAIIEAATLENARFLRVDERLGSIEKGKLADLILVEGDPLKDISVMRNVKRVMLNGVWVPTVHSPQSTVHGQSTVD